MPVNTYQPYDDQNIFAKILRRDIPNRTIYEDEWALAFHDINPQAAVHALVIPKGAYVSWDDFSERASNDEITGYIRAIGHVARLLDIAEPGYRLLSNIGRNGHQEVPHLHVHLFGGQALGGLLAK
jgi:histidine triad (HIT) family protein